MAPNPKAIDALRIDRTQASARRVPAGLMVAVLVLAAAGAGVAWYFMGPRPVVVRTAVAREIASNDGPATLLNASGYVTARREATVSSKVTGKVVEVFIEEGMKVEADQVLARLDASNVEKNLQLAQARLELAREALGETQAAIVQADREYNRLLRLLKANAGTQIELDRAETEARTLRARLQRQTADIAVSEREVALWRQELDDTIIRAPFAGVVTSKDAQPGEMISPVSAGGGFTRTGICTIVDMDSLEIEVDVSESYINRVAADQPVVATLDSYPDWAIPARVIAIIPTADRQKATVKVRVAFDRLDPRILPDMSVKVAFKSAHDDDAAASATRNVLIPEAAVHQRDGRDIVWIVDDGRVERRAVTVGATLGEEVSVAAGISSGERVVIEAPDDLADGVNVTEASP